MVKSWVLCMVLKKFVTMSFPRELLLPLVQQAQVDITSNSPLYTPLESVIWVILILLDLMNHAVDYLLSKLNTSYKKEL